MMNLEYALDQALTALMEAAEAAEDNGEHRLAVVLDKMSDAVCSVLVDMEGITC
jgi:hypothetical protein